ncbi:MAG: MerR family transcriptional regulator [Eubacteriales bacterium]
MDKIQTITQVTKSLGISTRMLRYYEQLGLLQSTRIESYSYRVYDEEACRRLNRILILRKLRIPLKQIDILLNNRDAVHAVNILIQNMNELNAEIDSLSTIRTILSRFVDALREKSGISLTADLLSDTTLLSMIAPIPPEKLNNREEKTMEDLNIAGEKLNRLTDRDVRIIYLPPATVVAYQYEGNEPENKVNKVIDKFVLDHDLPKIKPDLRHYGFNAPNPIDESNDHGYEMWVTIPDELEVPEPLVKKHFEGGLYAAHTIPFGAFEEWEWLHKWVQNSEKYEYNGNWDSKNMFGWLEESLNYVNRVRQPNPEGDGFQLDLLIPVKEKRT